MTVFELMRKLAEFAPEAKVVVMTHCCCPDITDVMDMDDGEATLEADE